MVIRVVNLSESKCVRLESNGYGSRGLGWESFKMLRGETKWKKRREIKRRKEKKKK